MLLGTSIALDSAITKITILSHKINMVIYNKQKKNYWKLQFLAIWLKVRIWRLDKVFNLCYEAKLKWWYLLNGIESFLSCLMELFMLFLCQYCFFKIIPSWQLWELQSPERGGGSLDFSYSFPIIAYYYKHIVFIPRHSARYEYLSSSELDFCFKQSRKSWRGKKKNQNLSGSLHGHIL